MSTSALRILLIEDNVGAARLRTLLEFYGHEVVGVPDGSTASQVADMEFDCVLMDLGLRGFDGCAVVKQMRTREGKTHPFIVAVNGSAEDNKQLVEAGIDLHLLKPVPIDDLCLLLRTIREKKCPSRGVAE